MVECFLYNVGTPVCYNGLVFARVSLYIASVLNCGNLSLSLTRFDLRSLLRESGWCQMFGATDEIFNDISVLLWHGKWRPARVG